MVVIQSSETLSSLFHDDGRAQAHDDSFKKDTLEFT
jgi:hypothetical protein